MSDTTDALVRPRASTMSLRARLLAGLALVAVVLCAVALFITSTTRAHLVDQVDEQLEEAIDPSRDRGFAAPNDELAATDERPEPPPGDVDRPEPPERLSAMFEGFIRSDGEYIIFFESNLPGAEYSPPDIDTDTIAEQTGEPFTVDSVEGDTTYRVLAIEGADGVFVRALPLDDVDDTMQRLVLFELLGIVAVVLTLAAVALWVIRLGIRPLQAMTSAADEIGEGDLSARLPEPAEQGTEAAALARTLNKMIGRLEVAIDERTQSEDRLRRFVSDASHELRTPVTTIRGYAELYQMGGLSQQSALDDAMRRTGAEADRMARLVDDMLTLAKLDQDRPLQVSEVDLGEVLGDIVGDLEVTAPDHHVELSLDDVDSADLVVEGDADRLRQVFVNVIGNAAVHTPADTTIDVSGSVDGDRVIVVVHDDGPGVDRDDLDRLTERFYRPDTSRSRQRGGSGLGLSIVAAATEAHGGDIDIESDVGVGTTVTVTLPRTLA